VTLHAAMTSLAKSFPRAVDEQSKMLLHAQLLMRRQCSVQSWSDGVNDGTTIELLPSPTLPDDTPLNGTELDRMAIRRSTPF